MVVAAGALFRTPKGQARGAFDDALQRGIVGKGCAEAYCQKPRKGEADAAFEAWVGN